MQTLRKKTSPCKYRNDPGRFFGDGVQFKAKLIGILEVGEARGDRMCQEALQDLKIAIRAAGEHKQRITIHVTIEGLRLRDEKTGDSLYHHPVHKISFIAQDMTDSRAFGYIYGSPDSGHRFFGIKTDKAASQVVLAMRDLFQVVFELKKKEIELARQQIQSKSIHEHQLASLSSLKSVAGGIGTGLGAHNDLSSSGGGGGGSTLSMLSGIGGSSRATASNRLGVNLDGKGAAKEMSPESVADLVDLEQELNSLQRGISQMERITPNEPAQPAVVSAAGKPLNEDDPFGDSFTNFPTYNLLPPPESGRSRNKPTKTTDTIVNQTATSGSAGQNVTLSSLLSPAPVLNSSTGTLQQDDDDSWLQELDQQNDVFDTSKAGNMSIGVGLPMAPLAPSESTSTPTQQLSEHSTFLDVDAAATAASNTNMQPSGGAAASTAASTLGGTSSSPTPILGDGPSGQAAASGAVKSDSTATAAGTADDVVMMPRDTDPFSPTRKKSDPFQEGGDVFAKLDPFEFEFNSGDATKPRSSPTASTDASRPADVFNGPLQVSLPPESSLSPTTAQPLNTAAQWRADVARLERQMSEPVAAMGNGRAIAAIGANSTVRLRPTPSGQLSAVGPPSSAFKQQTADVISSISNKKMPHLFGQESDSLSENETAPEPPPRPDSALHAEPPPLPPKKQFNDIIIRPRVTSGNAVPPSVAPTSVNSRYEFVNMTAKPSRGANAEVPPIPLPSRRVGRSDGTYPGPGRPRKPGHTDDDYLAPISGIGSIPGAAAGDVPPLLPPPTQISTRSRAQRQQSLSKPQDIYENKLEILQQQQQQQQQLQKRQQANTEASAEPSMATASLIPDITLSQLMTLSLDELAVKLNVPVSKLSTMTLVELTSYLSEFIEKSKPQRAQTLASQMSPLPPRRAEIQSIKPESSPVPTQSTVFKVNFDQQATFVAKFDDTFGEDFSHTGDGQGQDAFANFEQFNDPPPPVAPPPIFTDTSQSAPLVPSADRYAVFREIIDKELQEQQENADLIGEVIDEHEDVSGGMMSANDVAGMAAVTDDIGARFETNFDDDDFLTSSVAPQVQPPKIDTKITEVVAQAKDRYAALRDIILVENLFDNKTPATLQASQEFPEFSDEFNEDQDQDLKHIMDGRASSSGPDRLGLVDSRGLPAEPSSSALTVEDDDEDDDGGGESSLDSNDKDTGVAGSGQDKYEKLSTSTQQLDGEKSEKLDLNGGQPERCASQPSPNLLTAKQDNKFLTVAGSSGLSSSKDDLEIDELMQRAISNLSLDSRERISPANSATNMPTVIVTSGNSIALPRPSQATLSSQAQFNDVSTSPIPLQKSPTPGATQQQQRSPLCKSPQVSPVLSQLSAVSNLIDTATKQISTGNSLQQEPEVKHSKEFWATFDSPKPSIEKVDKRTRPAVKSMAKNSLLHLPPPPPSNTSQNDTAESPCSSDPRDYGWSKSAGVSRRWPRKDRHHTSSSSRDISPCDDEPSDFQKQKRIPSVGPSIPPPSSDRHGYYMRHTRRLNSCDEDYDYEEEFSTRRDHRKLKPGLSRSRDNFDLESPSWYRHAPHHTWSPQDMEQAAGMRARAFERSAYERTTYGPPVYDKRGVALPPNASSSYDRRSGYDKRSKYYRDYARPNYEFDDYGDSPHERYRDAGSFEKAKVGRRVDYENIYDEGRSPMSGMLGSSIGGSSGYKTRGGDYMYDRDRKSFDRESVESFESATRRRRSFGSGDVYGSMESHEEFRERYGPEKTRSLRKGMKLRAAGDIDYEHDSENDFHQRTRMGSGGNSMNAPDTRSLQRPNQLISGNTGSTMSIGSGQPRARKSSGSSPWDGEEPPLPGQKSWKRPSSAADSERRLTESRRVAALGQTPSGSDGEKDRRFRKKQRSRGKDIPYTSSGPPPPNSSSRYSSTVGAATHPRDNYDYMTYDDDDVDDEEDYADEDYDEPPTDEDKFERLNRRRHEMHQRMLESERRQHSMGKVPISSLKCSAPTAAAKKYPTRGGEYDFDDYEQSPTSRSNASASLASAASSYIATAGAGGSGGSATKFSFDGGFESDFNQSSPPPAPAGTASSCNSTPAATTASACVTPATKSSFRFSNDFSEREKMHSFPQNAPNVSSAQQLDLDSTQSAAAAAAHAIPPIVTQKLRFDDNVKVSQFDDAAFEDDFSNAQFDFEKEDQWHADSLQSASSAALMTPAAKKHNLRNSKLQQRQEQIKKSESINIFGKKSEDPFEDDEFFKAPSETGLANNNNNGNGQQLSKPGAGNGSGFQCDDDFNFAKFDENM